MALRITAGGNITLRPETLVEGSYQDKAWNPI